MLFAFVGKRGQSMKVLTWDGTGTIVIHKKLDAGRSSDAHADGIEDRHPGAIHQS